MSAPRAASADAQRERRRRIAHEMPVALDIDRALTAASRSFDFLYAITPANAAEAFEQFRAGGFRSEPKLEYRPLPFDPDRVKSGLYRLPIEKTEQPLLAQIFRDKQEELDLQVSMLRHRGTRRFFYGSLQLYGEPDDELQRLARLIVEGLGDAARQRGESVGCERMVEAARREIARYRERYAGFDAEVVVDDRATSLMVCGDQLLVPADARFDARRVEPLLQHEIGTHLLTYFNGEAQPLQLMCGGLAGYDPVQEGIAVLAEHLVGGLTPARLRLLAARVLATARLVDRAPFEDTFAFLADQLGYDERSAFQITLRIYRGGGLTKDMIYLRGLDRVLGYLGNDGALERLLIGKIGLRQAVEYDDLHELGLVCEPVVLPLYLERADSRRRLDRVLAGASVLDLAREAA